MGNKKSEFEIVREFTRILGLENRTDGSLFIYKKPSNRKSEYVACKPDGYYYFDGVTFILDAKAENESFDNQLVDYMKLEQNKNFIGFMYNGSVFKCFVKGKLIENETKIHNAQYYVEHYFFEKETNESIVEQSAKKLAKLFRNSGINKQMNVPFIGAVFLCLKFGKEIQNNTTQGIINLIKTGIAEIISDTPLTRKQKKVYLTQMLSDASLISADIANILEIISEISVIFNFINISDKKGHDTMNSFLKVFRKWNSVDAQEKGQVFTPDHIAQFMYKLINCNKNDVILDPTCGSGTFLTNAMANMLSETTDPEEQKNIKENHLIGIEKEAFNATLAGINMMLHGDGASNIFWDDCFRKLPTINSCYNKALMNPPFSQNKPELKFVLETLNNMEKNGLCAAIVPITCILNSKENNKLKKELLTKHNLIKVVRLPKKLFGQSASIQTAIVVFQAQQTYTGTTLTKNFLDDGYIELRNVGRIDFNSEEKNKEFEAKDWKEIKLNNEKDWPEYDDIDFSSLQKLDFMRQKLDFMLANKDLTNELIKNYGRMDIDIRVSDNPLNIQEWKKYKLLDLFTKEKGKEKSDENNPTNKNGTIPLIIASSNYNGVGYYIKEAKKLFSKNTISLVTQGDGASGIAKAHSYDYAANSCVTILSNPNLNPYINIFISTIISKFHDVFDFTYSFNMNRFNELSIPLPSKKVGDKYEPDWEWMEKYIKNEL